MSNKNVIYTNITIKDLFQKPLSEIKTSQEATHAYISNIFIKNVTAQYDFSKDSIVLTFGKAKEQYSFKLFQETADWLFFIKSFNPGSLNKCSMNLYNTIAQNSYYKCHIIINKKWPLFEELADRFDYFTNTINNAMSNLQSQSISLQDEKRPFEL